MVLHLENYKSKLNGKLNLERKKKKFSGAICILCKRIKDTRLKIADTDEMLNGQIDKYLHSMGEQPVVKFSARHIEDN